MSGRSRKSSPPSLPDTGSAISSPVSAAGPTPSPSPAGPQLDLFGQEVAPASPSRRRARERANETNATSGRHGWPSSASVALTASLGSRLRAATDTDGSMEYALTWSQEGYAVGAADLAAAGVGAPHIRQRLFWVAHAKRGRGIAKESGRTPDRKGEAGNPSASDVGGDSIFGRLGDPIVNDLGRNSGAALGTEAASDSERIEPGAGGVEPGQSGSTDFWSRSALIPCRDGKSRRTQPGLHPLAHGLPGRVGLLRGYGNAIVPQVAAAFVRAFLETESGLT
jgi:DNA (cytosine-5)-methyltransferase 1